MSLRHSTLAVKDVKARQTLKEPNHLMHKNEDSDPVPAQVVPHASSSSKSDSGQVLRRVKRGWMSLRISQIINETHDTKTFCFIDNEDGGLAFDYTPGQYLTFRYDSLATKPVVRSYTMSSAQQDGDFAAITVKRVDGGLVSNWMCDTLQVGNVLRARGPIGRFVFEAARDAPHLFMVAGGSGVTPFFSMLKGYARALGAPGSPASMTLLVSYRSGDDIIFRQELLDLASLPGIRVFITFTRNTPDTSEVLGGHGVAATTAPQGLKIFEGRIDADLLNRALTESGTPLSSTTFFTCGPVPMMDLVQRTFLAQGVPQSRIKMESFESN